MNATFLVDPRTQPASFADAMASAATGLRAKGPKLSLVETVEAQGSRTHVWSDLRGTTVVKLVEDGSLACAYLDVTTTGDGQLVIDAFGEALPLLTASPALDLAIAGWLREPAWLPRVALVIDESTTPDLLALLARAVADEHARRHAARAAAMIGGDEGRAIVETAAARERDPAFKARLEQLAKELW